MRQTLHDFFEDIDVAKMEAVLDSQIVGFLPYRDKKGRAVLFSRGYAWNKEAYDLVDSTKCAVLLILYSLTFPLTTMTGICVITDAKVEAVQDYYHNFRAFGTHTSTIMSLPCRFQRMDLFNENFMCHYFYAAIRPLLPTKFSKRIHFYPA
ncbi:uncharacterized protein LOC129232993 [Uloborus diversus]|uniref:uncharacterized protein LOC129232993 n=1 Tax=Uloborus diversus TaxID=327109 RepID=UPI00240A2BBA|nr:uncharacterized protein LOC129232993 [Uloborus diversus]